MLILVQVQVLALDRRFGFAGAAAVLVLVQVLDLDRRFVLPVLVQVLVWELNRRFLVFSWGVLRGCWIGVMCGRAGAGAGPWHDMMSSLA